MPENSAQPSLKTEQGVNDMDAQMIIFNNIYVITTRRITEKNRRVGKGARTAVHKLIVIYYNLI